MGRGWALEIESFLGPVKWHQIILREKIVLFRSFIVGANIRDFKIGLLLLCRISKGTTTCEHVKSCAVAFERVGVAVGGWGGGLPPVQKNQSRD